MNFTKSYKDGTTPTVAIIGAGVSGICAAIQLQRQLKLTTYAVFELEADIGGTWRSNTYPGCNSDAPSHQYSYSFAPNYEWSQKFAPQAEVLGYLKNTAKTYNIYDKVKLNHRVSKMKWQEDKNKWALHWIKTTTGEEGDFEADVVIHGTGVLRIPCIPKEFDTFKGLKWHSAQWDHSVDLTGKKVGIVGASASGVQIISTIADKVESLEVYSRSSVYITPLLNYRYTDTWRLLFEYVPFFYTFYRALHYWVIDFTVFLYFKIAWYSILHHIFTSLVVWIHRFRLVRNREIRRKLTPDYELGSRNIVLSNSFYPTFQKPNVTLHKDTITSIEGRTIKTADGSEKELDVLVLATGFEWVGNFPIGYWIGRNGIDISEKWGENPTTYYGTCVPNAPNFYLTWGPNSGILHHSQTHMLEIQVNYAINAISHMMKENLAVLEIKQEVADEFMRTVDRRIERVLFSTKYKPRFTNSMGKVRGFWYGGCTEFWWRLRKLHLEQFLTTPRTITAVDAKSGASSTETPISSFATLNGHRGRETDSD
ncbi:hypothetical protein BGW38_003211 [Lunasporangiospora selenospora]|uniref:FAD/NAD(P)-binding domain-containing protein n=1 Tax=Lunasporangiospora selenospora TaxID=979761 RepID=A0A9P6KHY6_9FUNG|nr:hypothetical protein BGW38_003211 [Lunasporangiospora selenospora]